MEKAACFLIVTLSTCFSIAVIALTVKLLVWLF